MSTMIVKQEVQATPQLIADLLRKFAASTTDTQFPFGKGTLLTLKPEVNKALGGVEGMPALVVMTGKGSPLGVVALHKGDGDITISFLSVHQIEGPFAMPVLTAGGGGASSAVLTNEASPQVPAS